MHRKKPNVIPFNDISNSFKEIEVRESESVSVERREDGRARNVEENTTLLTFEGKYHNERKKNKELKKRIKYLEEVISKLQRSQSNQAERKREENSPKSEKIKKKGKESDADGFSESAF